MRKLVDLRRPSGHAPSGTGMTGIDGVIENLGEAWSRVKMLHDLLEIDLRRQVHRQPVQVVEDAGVLNPRDWINRSCRWYLFWV